MRAFPFVPKSIKSLEPGDFFPVCLEDGRYACGRVLQLSGDELPTKTRSFFEACTTGLEPVNRQKPMLLKRRCWNWSKHVRAIQGVGAGVIGNVPLSPGLDEIPILLDSMGGPAACVLKGVVTLRPARRDEWGKLSVLRVLGSRIHQVPRGA
ncbi:MAG: hypothetical protein R3F21_02580 [Myxococcota bacterium]